MSYKIINELIEQFSCELVLLSSDEPEQLTGLLPILKNIHSQCMKLSLNSEAACIGKIRKIIDDSMHHRDPDMVETLDHIQACISEVLSSINDTDSDDSKLTGVDTVQLKQLEKKLNEFARLLSSFCPEDIPDLGAMLNNLDALIEISKEVVPETFHQVSIVCKTYVENMTLENMSKTKPVEEGLILLRSLLNHLKRGEPFSFDYSDVMELLDIQFKNAQASEAIESKIEPEPLSEAQTENQKISQDDMEILIDFITEAEENLETIEVSLIELEQDPANMDIINDIFRPFHTIKGVSGFLSLTKINQLAHTTENFLDAARSGDFLINDTATDVILESVDALKQLLARVKTGTQTGFMPPDDDVDIKVLRDKLQSLQMALTKGEKTPLGEILIQKGNIDSKTLNQALEIQKQNPDKKIGEILVEKEKATSGQVAGALMDQNHSRKKVATQVKVSTDKLDDLVNYAGELVIAQSMLKQKTVNDPSLTQNVTQLGLIVTNMQNIAMSMRMIPIKATFMKMIRLVRDLSRKSGKEINLEMVGEDTEIDRNVVEALYEPMVHMIRNSCDHGIEAMSDRTDQSKPSHGTIVLRAYHKGGNIIIEIEDDGKGLDKDQILNKAKSAGLIDGTEQMTDAQIYDLIMQPGFSTAKEITDVSGRGVGMDVVKSGIEKFRGQLGIESEKGIGSKFTISLPLTLAIIDGMLVRVQDERYVIPTIAIQKAFKPLKSDCFTVENKGEMIKDRGSLVPVIRLNGFYNGNEQTTSIWDNLVVVVESKNEKRALLIDELLGKDEYVIKSLGSSLENIKGIAGGAILADGRVGLILDIHGVFEVANG